MTFDFQRRLCDINIDSKIVLPVLYQVRTIPCIRSNASIMYKKRHDRDLIKYNYIKSKIGLSISKLGGSKVCTQFKPEQ